MDKTTSEKFTLYNAGITTSSILAYLDLGKQYFLFIDSSKHSWTGIFIQYTDQSKEDRTNIKIPHTITYQSGILQSSQKNLSPLTKEANAIYMSYHKIVFYLKDVHVMLRCHHAPLC